MKQGYQLLSILTLLASHSLNAAVLADTPHVETERVSATTAPNAVIKKKTPGAVIPRPQERDQAVNTIEIGGHKIEVPNDLSKLSPEQRKQLLSQTKNMNPEQLQAIAKSFQNKQGKPSEIYPKQPLEHLTHSVSPQIQKSTEELKRDQAFEMLLDEALPLSPEQITRLHKYYDLTLQAKATPPNAPPTPNLSTTTVHLEPGSPPPVIRLAAGFVTSLLFLDATGACWPITAYSLGDPDSFNLQWNQKDNALFIQSKKQYAHGNLAVRLYGLETPVMITLVSGQRIVDFRVDLHVGERGPEAKAPVVDTTFSANVNPILINILDGIPPKGSLKLSVIGGQGEAWLADNKIYFRSKLTVLSPAWVATVSSPDGTHVYELMLTPSIVASQNGKTIDIKLAGL